MAKNLRKQLNASLGFDEISFTVPYVFLPPRFKDISEKRNMVLFMDTDTVMHVRWEGVRQDEHHPLSPGACRRLFKECIRNMKRYRKDLDSFSKFVDTEAEVPFWDPREDSLTKDRTDEPAPSVEKEVIAVLDSKSGAEERKEEEMGGESPIPHFGWE